MRWLTSLLLALMLLTPGAAAAQGASSAARLDANGYYAEPYLTIEPGAHNATIRNVAVDRAGRYVVTGSDDKSLRIWSATDGRLLQTIRVPAGPGDTGKLFTVAISPDGAVIAAGGYTGTPASGGYSLYLFDRASGALIHRFANLPNPITDLQFSSDGLRLIATLSNIFGVRLYDVTRRLEIAADTPYGDSSFQASVAADGRIVTTSQDGNVRLYAPDLRLLKTLTVTNGKEPYGIAISPDGGQIALSYYKTNEVDILDARTLDRLYSADTSKISRGKLFSITWSADGSSLIAGGTAANDQGVGFLRIWSKRGRGSFRDLKIANSTILDIEPFADGRIAVVTGEPMVLMLDANAAPRWIVKPPILDVRLARLSLSRDGMKAEFNTLGSSRRLRFDARARSLLTDAPGDAELVTPQSEGLAIANWQDEFTLTLSGKPIALLANERSRALSVAPGKGSFVLGAEYTLRRYRADGALMWQSAGPGVAWAVNQSGDGRIAVAAYGDGTIRWYNLADGVEQLALFVHADGERWVAWTPKGYYTASPGGEDLIRWVVNRGLDAAPQEYPVGAYRDKFYRPDVIATILDTLDINSAVQLADAARGRPAVAVTNAVVIQQAPPVVTILDPADGASVRNSPIEVAYRISGKPGERIKRLRALIDNRETVVQRDLTIPASGTLDGTIKVPVEGIAPLLQLYAANEFADSAPATRKLSGGIARQDINKPVLYVLAIGISEYRNDPRLKLNFADDDARAFVTRMRAQKGGLYRDVVVRSLVDREATKAAIGESLSWLQRQMTNGDVATVFVSAHGETDGRGDLYLISHDADVRDEIMMRQTAVQWDDFDKDIKDLASRGKVLVFLDACKSGRVIPGKSVFPADIDKAVNELRESGNDVTIFSSSTGTQLSREDDKLGQGYFTYALLEALDGKGIRSGAYVTTGDLNRYIAERVKKLTEGAQTPKVSTPLGTTSNPPLFVIR